MNNIKEIIRQLAQGGRQSVSLVCTVDAVDKTARTVDCTPLEESAPLLGVNLQANQESTFGVVAFPKVGSYVVVGFVADGAAGIVLLTDEVEEIQVGIGNSSLVIRDEAILMNGGRLGGLVRIAELTTCINNIEKDINLLKSVFSGWTPVAQDGGAVLKRRVESWASSQLKLTKRSDYENKRIRQ